MPKPTLNALRTHSKAIVILTYDKDEPDKVADWDFEWFESDEAVEAYMDDFRNWAEADRQENDADLFYVSVTVPDTSSDPLVYGWAAYFGPDMDWAEKIRQQLDADPEAFLVYKPPPRKKAAKVAPAIARGEDAKVVRGRKKNPAAAAVKEEAPPEAPKKKRATKADKAALKKRIEERAANKPAPDAAPEEAAVQAFLGVGGGMRPPARNRK